MLKVYCTKRFKYLEAQAQLSNTSYSMKYISVKLFSFLFKENEELSPDLETRTIAKQNLLPSSEGESVTILIKNVEATKCVLETNSF